jgi:predicted transcriptional regulator
MGRRPKKSKTNELTELERRVMKVFWDRDDASAADVIDVLEDEDGLAPTTVHTVIARLRERNMLKQIPTVERAARYKAAVKPQQAVRRPLHSLISQFFGDSPQRLMAHLIKNEMVDAEELAELQKLLDDASQKKARNSKPKKRGNA